VPDSGEDVRGIGLDAHTAAAAIAALPTPKLVIDEFLVDFNPSRKPGNQGDQALAVRLSGSGKT
jgi:hypothetical protein